MNNKLQSLLSNFPANLEKAESNAAISNAVVEVENAVLQSNLTENSTAPFVSRDYIVGEPNTRGLSWKLNLLRLVAEANFCQLMRVGIHGGNTRVLGQDENLDITFQVYNALTVRYEELSKKAFQDFADSRGKDEEAEPVHRVGWVGQFLIDSPNEVFAAVAKAREDAANAKVTAMIEKKNEGLTALRTTFAPVRTPAAPRAKKEKAPKDSDSEELEDEDLEDMEEDDEETDSENED